MPLPDPVSPAIFLMSVVVRTFSYPSSLVERTNGPCQLSIWEPWLAFPGCQEIALLYLCLLPDSMPRQDDFKLKEIPFLSPKSRTRGMDLSHSGPFPPGALYDPPTVLFWMQAYAHC